MPEPNDDRTRQDYDQAYGIRITTGGTLDLVYRNHDYARDAGLDGGGIPDGYLALASACGREVTRKQATIKDSKPGEMTMKPSDRINQLCLDIALRYCGEGTLNVTIEKRSKEVGTRIEAVCRYLDEQYAEQAAWSAQRKQQEQTHIERVLARPLTSEEQKFFDDDWFADGRHARWAR